MTLARAPFRALSAIATLELYGSTLAQVANDDRQPPHLLHARAHLNINQLRLANIDARWPRSQSEKLNHFFDKMLAAELTLGDVELGCSFNFRDAMSSVN